MVAIEQSTGVSFGLTDEQKDLRELARGFAANEIRPHEHECDEHMRHPVDVIAKAHELGLMNLHVPEEYGGPALSAFDGMLVGEELYWGCSGMGTSISANGLGNVKYTYAPESILARRSIAAMVRYSARCAAFVAVASASSPSSSIGWGEPPPTSNSANSVTYDR